MGGFPKEATHVPLRPDRRPVGEDRRPSSRTATTTAGPATPGRTTAPWSTASSGTCTPAPRGPTRPSAMAPGRPSTTASTAGARTAPGPGSSTPCCSASTAPAASTASCGASTPPSAAPTPRPPGREKIRTRAPRLGGPTAAQVDEPEDHALGRSRGGFSTKAHLVCDGRGILLAVWVTAGQRHESRAFEAAMSRARRPRRAGRPTLAPAGGAATRVTATARCGGWLRRHHIVPVIPTRKDQPRRRGLRQGRPTGGGTSSSASWAGSSGAGPWRRATTSWRSTISPCGSSPRSNVSCGSSPKP